MASDDLLQAHVVPFGDNSVLLDNVPPLDPTLYSLSPEEAAFFKATTAIDDDEALKAHILLAQEKAYRVAPYPCIYGFTFLRMAITRQPKYDDIVRMGRERENAIFLDIGCCFAVDARKAASDGFPAHRIITSDLKKEFFEIGHILFRTTKDTWPAHFVPGDALDPQILSVVPPTRAVTQKPMPDLSTLTSLNPLQGHCAVINAAAFFHLFNEEQQLHLARALAGLLSPEPGSIICGAHAGKEEKGICTSQILGSQYEFFCHSPQSWREMWDGIVFEKGEVEVRAILKEIVLPMGRNMKSLSWSITRL
ncbi:hypothetical protein ID866_9635 [Astraeus odoratus]|nr:hypothetical protein ID866_9635 [Astraeus odoratus]